ncbi:MAG: hypothetical protein IPI46_05855 [Bacteroidetes bacterium]|nr:hypothetical protein [Bacteroidota bacterium]
MNLMYPTNSRFVDEVFYLSQYLFETIMDTTEKISKLDMLANQVEACSKTSLELYKLMMIEKFSTVVSVFISQVLMVLILMAVILFASIGLALWIGHYFAQLWYGFIILAGMYSLIFAFIFLARKSLLYGKLKNLAIQLLLKDKE